MRNCTELMEQLSAYADGELTGSDKELMEDHLRSCENCAALLGLYREMSAAIGDSCVSAPEALYAGVMNEILTGEAVGSGDATVSEDSEAVGSGDATVSEDSENADEAGATVIEAGNAADADVTEANDATSAAGAADDAEIARKRKALRVILTRYVPIAACLAVALLVLPRFLSLNKTARNDYAMPAGGASSELAFQVDDADGTSGAPSGSYAGNGTAGSQPETAVTGASPGAPAPAPAPAPSHGGVDESGGGDNTSATATPGNTPVITVTPDEQPDSNDEADDADLSNNAAESEENADGFEDEDEELTIALVTPGFPEEQNGSREEEQDDSQEREDEGQQNQTSIPTPTPTPTTVINGEENDSAYEDREQPGGSLFTDAIYAIVQLNGGLTELMALYGVDPVDGMEEYYNVPIQVPREMAEMVLDFIRDLDGVSITIVDENGGIIVFMYIPD